MRRRGIHNFFNFFLIFDFSFKKSFMRKKKKKHIYILPARREREREKRN